MLSEIIKAKAKAYFEEFVGIRRYLHQNPELSYQEYNTSLFVQTKLNEWNIPFKVIAETGVVGLIEGNNPTSRIIALRADMDALPILEENNIDFKSQNEGVMHACGHDVHTTCLLGAAKILNELKEQWDGTIKLIFQPGEEKNPGGASLMIKEGILENPTPAGIFGLHVHPLLEVGKVSFRKGKVMASADELYFTIKGKGGHAAQPNLTVDTILVAAELITSLQKIISRNRNPFSPSVLSICSMQGGHSTNVIPSEVKLKGTFRAMDETWRYHAHELIKKEAAGIAAATGAEIDTLVDVGYPTVDNNDALTEEGQNLAKEYLDQRNVEETELRMGAEDFGYYTQKIPGCFYRLGVRNETLGYINNVHTPNFMVDERAIEIGIGLMTYLGINAKA
ncbi:M20 metallopeptidase family protein [Rhizosphaericola mali]|uniref:Amidohydrolase n=1 Tax=Rhizosphaericola mali TaxID=2545455 RepID=A0A5P2G1F5_9BACT|nr:M20 family metallopeptidase [Rhizosphaericola mali]QES89265.1 amidohydrolase [Rhizosphaericola mali]